MDGSWEHQEWGQGQDKGPDQGKEAVEPANNADRLQLFMDVKETMVEVLFIDLTLQYCCAITALMRAESG